MDGLRHRLTTKVAGNGYSPLLRSPRLPPTLLLSPHPPSYTNIQRRSARAVTVFPRTSVTFTTSV